MNTKRTSLFFDDLDDYKKIKEEAIKFNSAYNGGNIIQDDIFNIAKNYVRRKEKKLEIIRIPIEDEELWAFTLVRYDTIFVCVNAALPLNKQIFAMAHELYHIYCYVEKDSSLVLDGNAVLQKEIMSDSGNCREDLEANAFAGLLLMPKDTLISQMDIYDIDNRNITVDDVIKLMDIFAIPYRAVVLRLIESNIISESYGEKLLSEESEYIINKIEITGVAKRWQLDGKEMVSFGSLIENMEFNRDNDAITDLRYTDDKEFIDRLKEELDGVE